MNHNNVAGQPCRVRRPSAVVRLAIPLTDVPNDSREHFGVTSQSSEPWSVAALQLALAEFAPQAALDVIAQEVLTAVDADGAAIAVATAQTVVCCSRAGSLAPLVGTPIDTRSGLAIECLRSGTAVRCDDTDTDPRVDSAACVAAGIRSVLVVPVRRHKTVLGILAAFSLRVGAFGEREIGFLQLLAALASPRVMVVAATVQVDAASAGPSSPSDEKVENETVTPGIVNVSPAVAPEAIQPARSGRWASPGKINECLDRIRQDPALQVLGRAKAYLTIEALYDGGERSEAIAMCQRLMFQRAAELGVQL